MSQYPSYSDDAPQGGSGVNRWLVAALLVLLGILVARLWDWGDFSLHNPHAVPRTVVARGELAGDEKSTVELFKAAKPSVVNITTLATAEFGLNPIEIPQGTGSGFIWDEQGYVVTNYHVIRGASRAKVTLADGTTKDGILVGADPDNDLAVLKIRAPQSKLSPLAVGTSGDLQVGQKVFAIGNPFGLDHTLTTGIISGLGREILSVTRRPIRDVIQTDAAINPGNSGGPLLDSAGRLIGVNTAIYSTTGTSAGIGFAVPVDAVNRVVPQLIAKGKIERPTLGIIPRDLNAEEHGIDGVLIYRVLPDSGAAAAGLQGYSFNRQDGARLGDIIVAIDKQPTPNTSKLRDILDKRKAGDTVTVTVQRDGEKLDVAVQLQAQ
jgi:S1-C subfamily serine protease